MSLQVLSVPMDLVHDTFLDTLSTLPNLQAMTFSQRRSVRGSLALHRTGGFNNIRKLMIPELSANAEIIRSTNGHSLDTLHVANARSRSLSAIVEICVNIRELFIEFPYENPTSLLPLSSCKRLEKLDIRAHNPLIFTHYDLRDLLQSWYIRHLSLNPRPSLVPPRLAGSLPTLRSLVAAAECGPNLRHLGIYLDASGHHLSRYESVMTWEDLDSLDLGVSTCGCEGSACEIQVAEGVFRLFPRARLQVDDTSSAWVKRLASKFDEVAGRLR
jgi:hypothetical protein